MSAPWWCRKFGHAFVQRPRQRINETRWEQPAVIDLDTYCRRCGTAPAPQAGPCTVTWESGSDVIPSSSCGLRHGHEGAHKDPNSGMVWWLAPETVKP